jgi:hypothetical protein
VKTSIKVRSQIVGSKVSKNNTIWIHHWYNLQYILFQKILILVVVDEFLDQGIDNKRATCLAGVNTCCDEIEIATFIGLTGSGSFCESDHGDSQTGKRVG